jgi:hypothetical protein
MLSLSDGRHEARRDDRPLAEQPALPTAKTTLPTAAHPAKTLLRKCTHRTLVTLAAFGNNDKGSAAAIAQLASSSRARTADGYLRSEFPILMMDVTTPFRDQTLSLFGFLFISRT